MGIFDSILGSVLGGNNQNQGAIGSILSSVLASQGGIGGIVQKMNQGGLGNIASSWVGNGPNQPVDPGQLGHALGHDQVDQWSQQTGLSHDTILSELSKVLPHAVDQMTPGGQVPAQGQSPFDAPGLEMKS